MIPGPHQQGHHARGHSVQNRSSGRLGAHNTHLNAHPGMIGLHQGGGFSHSSTAFSSMQQPPRFDLSDFPALGGGDSSSDTSKAQSHTHSQHTHHQSQHTPHQTHPHPSSMPHHASQQHTHQQQQHHSQQHHPQPTRKDEFAIHKEDFPALCATPGANLSSSPASRPASSPSFSSISPKTKSSKAPSTPSLPSLSASSSAPSSSSASSSSSSAAAAAPEHASLPGLGMTGLSGLPTSGLGAADASQRSAPTTPSARFGLTGLLGVIRMTDPDLNTLALGTDLTTLGLNLNASEVLYATFAYPCVDTPTRADPDFVLPHCYYMQPPALKTSHLAKFQLETLFYIFYNMPKDTLQVYAAKELYNRNWRYHKELKLWFSREAPKDGRPEGAYIHFDINTWERRVYRDVSRVGGLKFMTEEEQALL